MLKKRLSVLFLFVALTISSHAQESLLHSGPMVGHIEMKEANIWLQTKAPASVKMVYWKDEESSEKYEFTGKTSQESSNTIHIKLNDLSFGTTYNYELFIDGTKVERPYKLQFRTQELWQWRRGAPDFSVALGSCLYINDRPDDRPGEPYGSDPGILETIAEKNPDLMIWMGDNVYYREPDFYTEKQMDERYKDARDTPEMQKLLATAVNLATWDDHDYGPNNSNRSYRMREEALNIFKRYWANPGYGTKETDGVFSRYKYNDVEFFITDDRFYRSPNQLKDPNKPFFGDKQLQWLKEGLASSYATFKFVVVGNQVTNRAAGSEVMAKYKKEYEELMDFLNRHDVRGVVFLSGDRHYTELLKTEREGNYPIYEFTSSPLSAGVYSSLDEGDEFENPQRIEGTLVYKEHSFGMMHVSGERGERILTMQTFNREGKKLWEFTINQQDLRQPR